MTELYINGNKLELGNLKIQKVFQINNIGEPKDRQLDYTKKFDIPDTVHNRMVLDMLGVQGSLSRMPYKRLKGKLIENSVEIIPDGVVVISSKSKGKYQAHIYAGNVFLFDLINSKKINELIFFNLNHETTKSEFVNSFNNDDGYIYALADFGNLKESKIEINHQLPSIYVHTLWDMIFKEAGVGYYGNIFNNPKFKELVITMKRGYTDDDNINYNDAFTGKGVTNYISQEHNNTFLTLKYIYTYSEANPEASLHGTAIEIQETKDYIINAKITVEKKNENFVNSIFSATLYRGHNSPDNGELFSESEIVNLGSTYSISKKVSLVSGDRLTFEQTTTLINSVLFVDPTIGERSLELSITSDDNLLTFSFKKFIGNMTQTNFLKDVMQHFGLIFKKRRNQLAYDFVQIKDVLKEKSNIDWTDKFINEIKQTYKLGKYAQHNRFEYNYSDENEIPFADGILKIDNENLPIEKSIVKRPYNAPKLTEKKIGSEKLLSIPFWKAKRNDDGIIEEWKPFSSKNYICKIKKINTTINYGLKDATTETFSGTIPILDFDGLDYQTILNQNYQELKKVLDFNFVVKAKMLLNEIDIQNLDLFKTIYLEQYGADFYVNKVSYINSTINSDVELVKIKRTD